MDNCSRIGMSFTNLFWSHPKLHEYDRLTCYYRCVNTGARTGGQQKCVERSWKKWISSRKLALNNNQLLLLLNLTRRYFNNSQLLLLLNLTRRHSKPLPLLRSPNTRAQKLVPTITTYRSKRTFSASWLSSTSWLHLLRPYISFRLWTFPQSPLSQLWNIFYFYYWHIQRYVCPCAWCHRQSGLIPQNIVSVARSLLEDTPIRSFVFFCLLHVWFGWYPNPLAQFPVEVGTILSLEFIHRSRCFGFLFFFL